MLAQPHIIALLVFNAAYLLASTVVAIRAGNGEFAFYLAVMLLLGAAVLVVHRRVNLSVGVLWGLSVWGLAHMAGGLVPVPAEWPINGDIRVLYSLWLVPDVLKYDHMVHAYGFAVTTWLCWEGLRRIIAVHLRQPESSVAGLPQPNSPIEPSSMKRASSAHPGLEGSHIRPTPGMLVLVTAAGMGFGAMNEVVEFIATLTMPQTNVGGYANTGWDLVSNLAGCLIAAAFIRARAG